MGRETLANAAQAAGFSMVSSDEAFAPESFAAKSQDGPSDDRASPMQRAAHHFRSVFGWVTRRIEVV